jgi:uncharacterized membrane protein (DUF4010 family)
MFSPFEDLVLLNLDSSVVKLILGALLGMFLGLEREWSQKSAGIRTFALVSLLGSLFVVLDSRELLTVGGLLVIAHAVLLAVRSLVQQDRDGLLLTTSTSLLVAYGVGGLVGTGLYIEAVTVAVLSSLLLILKRELHEFAWGLSREEVRSATEFAILAFVIYPVLPPETMGPWNVIQPRMIWLLVIAISAIGFVNYVLVKRYEGQGIAFTAFFGGLVNSTAVIAEMSKRASTDSSLIGLAVGAILLANAAMAIRNALIVAIFLPSAILTVGLPLGAIAITGILISIGTSNWSATIEADLESPFSLRNALTFGMLFLIVLLVSAAAQETLGAGGFIATTFLAGLVSSGTAATTAISLVSTGQITTETAVWGVISGTVASILVKVFFAAAVERKLVKPVLLYSAVLILVGIVVGFTYLTMV